MLRCFMCGNEGRFYVTETVRQRSLIETDGPYTYNFLGVAESLTVEEWESVECAQCSEVWSEEDLKDEYNEHHPEEITHAPDVTPEPGPLA